MTPRPRWQARLDRALEHVLVALLALMTVNVVWQVFSRFVLRSPSNFTDELARYLFIWLGLRAVDVSNVMLVCPNCDRPTRVRHLRLESGARVRSCGRCGKAVEGKTA